MWTMSCERQLHAKETAEQRDSERNQDKENEIELVISIRVSTSSNCLVFLMSQPIIATDLDLSLITGNCHPVDLLL